MEKFVEKSTSDKSTVESIEVTRSVEKLMGTSVEDEFGEYLQTENSKIIRKRARQNDITINPSYTSLRNFPYNVVCRRRFHQNKIKMMRQMNKEILHIAMMQTFAIDGIRVNRVFSVGFQTSGFDVPDFATESERRRLRELLSER